MGLNPEKNQGWLNFLLKVQGYVDTRQINLEDFVPNLKTEAEANNEQLENEPDLAPENDILGPSANAIKHAKLLPFNEVTESETKSESDSEDYTDNVINVLDVAETNDTAANKNTITTNELEIESKKSTPDPYTELTVDTYSNQLNPQVLDRQGRAIRTKGGINNSLRTPQKQKPAKGKKDKNKQTTARQKAAKRAGIITMATSGVAALFGGSGLLVATDILNLFT